MGTLVEDAELVRRARSGDGTAFGELARRWAARVLAMCRARLRSLHAAEDAAQETLLRGFRGLDSLNDPERFGGWIRGIAHRVCLDWRKKKQNGQVPLSRLRPGRVDALLPTTDDPAALERDEEHRRLQEELDELDEHSREILHLYYTRDLTYRELAELLDVSVGTVNARLSRARERLRHRLIRTEIER